MDAQSIKSFVLCVEGTCDQGPVLSFHPAQGGVTAEPADAIHQGTLKMHIEETNLRRHCAPFCVPESCEEQDKDWLCSLWLA